MRFVVTRLFRVAQRVFAVGEELTAEAISHIESAGESIAHLLARGWLVQAHPPESAPALPSLPPADPVVPPEIKADSKKSPNKAASVIAPASQTE